ncbi:hypothetical protein GALMADRAFT_139692 [Galerina marginata CBS 339.88]|uniref:Uncharacterized protein n=1 Tax=Galerina marginata (strain CBS 339.88) TaxID=685588 RepID=A0A067TA96_GALM3|nr:hypothetical protein GALMADRAFT_139692 [Galerina marginata CBS 339.88]
MHSASRVFRATAACLLTCALVATLLVSSSITIPRVPSMDLARTQFNETGELSGVLSIVNATGSEGLTEIRFGVWSACYFTANDTQRICLPSGYNVTIQFSTGNHTKSAVVTAGLTRVLVTHPIGTVITFIAVLLNHLNGLPILIL